MKDAFISMFIRFQCVFYESTSMRRTTIGKHSKKKKDFQRPPTITIIPEEQIYEHFLGMERAITFHEERCQMSESVICNTINDETRTETKDFNKTNRCRLEKKLRFQGHATEGTWL